MTNIRVNEHFKGFLASKKYFQLLKGGRAGGKSHHAALKMIFYLLGVDPETWKPYKKPFTGVIMRDTFDSIRDSQYKEICTHIKDYGLENRIIVGKSPLGFYCPETGHEIFAKGFRKSQKRAEATIKSIKNPTMVWVEEPPDVDEEDFDKMVMSVRVKEADCQIILTHNTDIDPEHWIRKRFYKTELEDAFYHHSTFEHNFENLNEATIKNYEAMRLNDPERYATDVLGHWGTPKVISPFATQYDPDRHLKECHFIPTIPLRISFDFNLDPFAFLYYQFWRDEDGYHLHYFEEETIRS